MSQEKTAQELQQALEDSFVDVRRAYRLLYHYQRRVLDIVRYAGEYLHIHYHSGWPRFCNGLPNGIPKLHGQATPNRWAWDWIPMYEYDFHHYKSINGQELRFSMIIQSDTGLYDSELDASDGSNRLKLPSFCEESQASTRFVFIVARGNGAEWQSSVAMLKGKADVGEGLRYESTVGDFVALAKPYPLSLFADEEGAKKQLDDFVAYCTQNGLPEIDPEFGKSEANEEGKAGSH